MKKLIAFGASSSKESINKQFASYLANSFDSSQFTAEILDLNDFEMPIYSIDKENESGIPDLAKAFKEKIVNADGIIISFAEHNSSYTTAFKNIFDWISRIESDIWHAKPMLLLSTSPGGRGGITVLQAAYDRISRSNENVVGKFSLPFFTKNFDSIDGVIDSELSSELEKLSKELEIKILS